MSKAYFDEAIAAGYDEDSGAMFAPGVVGPTVDFLAALAGEGAALELGVGTGRVALPLSERGVAVQGIDESAAMVARLRVKPGADRVQVTIGDFATTRLDGTFSLVYLVYNTITNLTTQEAQVDCFHTAAAHLAPGGHFVIEVFVPILQLLHRGETTHVFEQTPSSLSFDEYEVATQTLTSHHYRFAGGSYRRFSVPFRYVWPAELDLMARLAGMALVERWADWDSSLFTSESPSHISVWRK